MTVRLSKINNVLLVLIILIDGYIVIGPFLPAILFHAPNHAARQRQLVQKLRPSTPPATPQPNQLVVPSMLLDQPIYDGPESQQYSILNKGIWRFSYGSTPDKGGNTVLIGHRFTYTNPRGVFYYLNEVKMGDEIGVWWNNKNYLYRVRSITEVPPTDTAIEHNTSQPELTLFTCTPLWLPKDRLVVVANLETKP